MARCDFCFKEKPGLQQPLPKFPAVVCKGCFYEIDRVIGFLAHYGSTIGIQAVLPENPPSPPRIPKRPKSKSGLVPQATRNIPLKE